MRTGIAHESIALSLLKDPEFMHRCFNDFSPSLDVSPSWTIGFLGAVHQSVASYIIENPTLLKQLELRDIACILRRHAKVYLKFFKDQGCKDLFFSKLSSKRQRSWSNRDLLIWNRSINEELLKMTTIIDKQESSSLKDKGVHELVDIIFKRPSDRQDLQECHNDSDTIIPSP